MGLGGRSETVVDAEGSGWEADIVGGRPVGTAGEEIKVENA